MSAGAEWDRRDLEAVDGREIDSDPDVLLAFDEVGKEKPAARLLVRCLVCGETWIPTNAGNRCECGEVLEVDPLAPHVEPGELSGATPTGIVLRLGRIVAVDLRVPDGA